MHCDMLKIQDGGAIVEKVNCTNNLSGFSLEIIGHCVYFLVPIVSLRSQLENVANCYSDYPNTRSSAKRFTKVKKSFPAYSNDVVILNNRFRTDNILLHTLYQILEVYLIKKSNMTTGSTRNTTPIDVTTASDFSERP